MPEVTTNLTFVRPYRLPFEEDVFWFHPEEFARLFPTAVVRWMVEHPRPGQDPDRFAPLRPMPAAHDLPVVVATRMSLSFPVLLGAVPLHAFDRNQTLPHEQQRPERCWFSDGGLSSNFPVHFFDAPLPRWPTFAINLRPTLPNTPPGRVDMAQDNDDEIAERWQRFDGPDGRGNLFGFLVSLLDSSQSWMDNTQSRLPGYRDRIVHVSLEKSEGGLNLDMPPALIEALAQRGREAGRMLVERYTDPQSTLSWDNHRWVRYRSTMALLEQMLHRIGAVVESPDPSGRTLLDLVMRAETDRPPSYRWQRNEQRDFARDATAALVQLARGWRAGRQSFDEGAPRPTPELRVMPRI